MNNIHHTALGFDYGTKRIGVAVGQTLTATATPLTTISHVHGQPAWEPIARLIEEWQPEVLVVGMPLNMDGTEHAMTLAARNFAEQLRTRYRLPVHLIDERLSSVEAEHTVASAGRRVHPRSKSAKEAVDKIAAQIILQNWLASPDSRHAESDR